MAFSYVGNFPNQQVSNSGVLTLDDINNLESNGELGGSLELIQEITADGSALNIDFTNIKENKYDKHVLFLKGIFFAGTNKLPRMRLSNDGGSSFESTTNYMEAYQSMIVSTFTAVRNHQTYFNLINNVGDEKTEVGNSYTILSGLGNSSTFSFLNWHSTGMNSGGTYQSNTFGGGIYRVTETINAIRIFEATVSHNITGTATLYGVKKK